ncbi:diguanylate cyclase, partial [Deltaproteobacteria bacterium OttesenSCG-928-K17]|nr:diguanylate cyclase [Deltaproteobacteria bacterium OttesenSCG-928-K17]
RASIANTDITIRGESLMVTISGGVAEHRAGENINDTIGRADNALYLAKNSGRNQVRMTAEDCAALDQNASGKESISL